MLVLFRTLFDVLLMLSPINPMISEFIFQKMFKSHVKSLGLSETMSIHLQNWPMFQEDKIDIKLEEEMQFTRDLIEIIRALKEENRIRMRWPNKKIITEPKEDMPEIIFPDLIKKVGNVKELEVKKSVDQDDKLKKAESKYCNIYLDIEIDDNLLAERLINDLIRNIQFTRKKNGFEVGEKINLKIGANMNYLKTFIEKYYDFLADKVSAEKLDIFEGDLTDVKNQVLGKLNVCQNRKCLASLKDNILKRLKKESGLSCPHCNSNLKQDDLNSISFSFKKI
jgi:valyl-tRNA synthetase